MSSLAPSRTPLSPVGLAQIARNVAGNPRLWVSRVEYRAGLRWYRRLISADGYEVWLLSWLPGQQTGFHDHGASAGAFAVAAGSLSERVAPAGRPESSGTIMAVGSIRSFGPDHVHDVRNEWVEPAVSIHAYSPPLTSMRRYGIGDDGLLRVTAEEREW